MSSKSSKSYKYAIQGKKARDALNQEEQELYDLCNLAGVEISPAVLRIILDLLKLNVSPMAIAQMLKSVIHQGRMVDVPSVTSESKAASSSRPSSRKGDKSTSSKSKASSGREERHRQEKAAKTNSHKSSENT
ncbi:Mitotic-spindle organizing protein 2A [Holothuria leucospilota]|uniref:Mitotic-spindle organizing protein 2A n=1 Tax=Holothuria leucospilota TaxID=206669 RepID=A0A9Q1CEZ5_HOLLE|nr:Mitotic-spindle organizing protein 2A [Holothuria leucospilota]